MQTYALLLDSWRLIKSRKLFWITVIINLIVLVLYGSIGFSDRGMSILYGLTEFETPRLAFGTILARELYVSIFSGVIVTIWLGWIAAGLALVSTSSIYPDFLSEGAIDMVLAKPISRTRVFFVKYLGSLLFVLFQVTIFCVGAFLCVGLRLNDWNWGLFIAIPLVVLFFSYLYCVSVLVGVMTRSTLAAILVTALFWFGLWVVHSAETITRSVTFALDEQAKVADEALVERKKTFDELAAQGLTSESNEFERARGFLGTATLEAENARASAARAARWLSGLEWATAVLPKHRETIGLADRWLGKAEARSFNAVLMDALRPRDRDDLPPDIPPEARRDIERQRVVDRRVDQAAQQESAWWIIGTSIGFEIMVLCLAAWLFARRDF